MKKNIINKLNETYKDLKSIELPLLNIRISVAQLGDIPEARALAVIDEEILKNVKSLEDKIKNITQLVESMD